MEVWPSESPEHIDDAFTLTLTVDRDVHEDIGRFASLEAARDAAQRYVDGRDGGLPGAR